MHVVKVTGLIPREQCYPILRYSDHSAALRCFIKPTWCASPPATRNGLRLRQNFLKCSSIKGLCLEVKSLQRQQLYKSPSSTTICWARFSPSVYLVAEREEEMPRVFTTELVTVVSSTAPYSTCAQLDRINLIVL